MRKISMVFIFILLTTSLLFASKWLYVGPIYQKLPFIAKGEKEVDELKNIHFYVPPFSPKIGREIEIIPGQKMSWKVYDENFRVPEKRAILLFASYIFLRSWERVNVEFTSPHPFSVYLDGEFFGRSKDGSLKKNKLLEQGKHSVFVVENNIAIKREIILGIIGDDSCEIISGLNEGAEVIVEGVNMYRNMDEIKIRK